jgi:hypothetical protein
MLQQVTQLLERTDIYSVLPREWVFVHVHDGMRAAAAAMQADGSADAALAAAAAAADSAQAAGAGLPGSPQCLPQACLARMESIPEHISEVKGKEQQQHVSIEMAGDKDC